jgi:predicted MFS family arabinose efflux permease
MTTASSDGPSVDARGWPVLSSVQLSSAPARPPNRAWLALAGIGTVMACHGYLYSVLEPLAKQLQEVLGFSDTQLGILSAAYNVPNLLMAVAGGMAVDHLGARRSLWLFSAVATAGAVLMASSGSFWSMVLARVIFGMGGESIIIASLVGLSTWFRDSRMGVAIGIGVSSTRLGAYLAVTSTTWAGHLYSLGWRPPLQLAAAVGMLMLVAASFHFWLGANVTRQPVDVPPQVSRFRWADVGKLGRSFWYAVGVCATFYAVIGPFRTFAIKYFVDTRGVPLAEAGSFSGAMLLVAIVLTPAVGSVARTGVGRALFLTIGSGLAAFALPILVIHATTLWVPILLLGAAMSCVAGVIWTLAASVVPADLAGTALGVMILLQNLAIILFNVLAGTLIDGSSTDRLHKYSPMLFMLVCLSVCSMAFSVALAVRERSRR